MARYRFRTADGQIFESEAGIAAIRKAHPGAVITHRVVAEPNGESSLRPYEGEKALPDEPAVDYESQKVAELLNVAKDRGIDLPGNSKKADVIAALVAHDEAVASGQIPSEG